MEVVARKILNEENAQFGVYALEIDGKKYMPDIVGGCASKPLFKKLLGQVRRIAQRGIPPNSEICRQLKKGVYEYRLPRELRTFLFKHDEVIIIFSGVFEKSKKKKLQNEAIEKAYRLKDIWDKAKSKQQIQFVDNEETEN